MVLKNQKKSLMYQCLYQSVCTACYIYRLIHFKQILPDSIFDQSHFRKIKNGNSRAINICEVNNIMAAGLTDTTNNHDKCMTWQCWTTHTCITLLKDLQYFILEDVIYSKLFAKNENELKYSKSLRFTVFLTHFRFLRIGSCI